MRCRKVEKMLPLYIEQDLSAQKQKEVRDHLNLCPECYGLFEEFSYTQKLVRTFQAPSVDENFFNQVSQAVRRESVQSSRRFSLIDYLRINWTIPEWFTPKTALVIPVALLIVLVSLSSWRTWTSAPYSNKESISQSHTTVHKEEAPNIISKNIELPKNVEQHSLVEPPIYHSHTNRAEKSRALTTYTTLREPLDREDSMDLPTLETAGFIEEEEPSTMISMESEEIVKSELQTTDPEVHIIWFSSKQVDLDGTPESEEVSF
jgi:hypothetical protein